MIYKVIPGPMEITGTSVDATKLFENIINSAAVSGWKYHSMEVITSVEKSGCINQNPDRTSLYMLIFYKED